MEGAAELKLDLFYQVSASPPSEVFQHTQQWPKPCWKSSFSVSPGRAGQQHTAPKHHSPAQHYGQRRKGCLMKSSQVVDPIAAIQMLYLKDDLILNKAVIKKIFNEINFALVMPFSI